MNSKATHNRSVVELTLAEQDALEFLTAAHYDRPATWAQNLLCFHYGRCRAPLTGGEYIPKSLPVLNTPLAEAQGPSLVVMPTRPPLGLPSTST